MAIVATHRISDSAAARLKRRRCTAAFYRAISVKGGYIVGVGKLFDQVRRAIREDRYVFSDHADNVLRERRITHWQIVDGVEHGRVLGERSQTKPNPTVEVEQILPDGVAVKAVWAHVRALDVAKLVTVHFFDR